MLTPGESSFECLKEAYWSADRGGGNPEVLYFAYALNEDAFRDKIVHPEPICARHKVIGWEALARPQVRNPETGEVKEFSIGSLSETSKNLGIEKEFDALTCSNALKMATQKLLNCRPITLNISVSSALSAEFWDYMERKLNKFKPQELIFELLEHDVDPRANISYLLGMKEQGYRFALDDFSIGNDHDNRLSAFRKLIDYAKMDGPLVRAWLGDKHTKFNARDLEDSVNYVKKYAPQAKIILERVRSQEEVNKIFTHTHNFYGVQGKNLKPHMFAYAEEKPTSNLAQGTASWDINSLTI